MLTASEKISAAIIELENGNAQRGDPFFAAMCYGRKIVADSKKAETMCTTGQKVFYYNPEYIESISVEEVMGVLVHECFHDEQLHPLRALQGNMDMEDANVAGDYVNNAEIIAAGYRLPAGVLEDHRFLGMSLEQAYKIVHQDRKKQGKGGAGDQHADQPSPDPGKSGGFDVPRDEEGQPLDNAQQAELERDMAEEVIINSQALAGAGMLSGWIKRLVKEQVRSKVRWQDVVKGYVNVMTQKDYSWEIVDEDAARFGFIMPSLNVRDVGEIVLAEDVSGSIDIELHHEFVREGQELLDTVQPSVLRWLEFNDRVIGDKEYVVGEVVEDSVCPSGGTKFQPIFDHIKKNGYQPEVVVVLTDLDSCDVPEDPGYPVIWVSYGKNKAPFGELVMVDRK